MNSKAFRTVSILLVIFGIFNVIGGAASLANANVSTLGAILSMLSGVLSLYAGITGAKAVKSGDSDKAALCKKLGYGLIALSVIGSAVGFITSSGVEIPGVSASMVIGTAVIGAVISLILPVLYLIGAKKLGE